MTSIFHEIDSNCRISSWEQYDELLSRLKDAIERELVKEIAPSSDMNPSPSERWFVEMSSGVVFRLRSPEPPAFGEWSEVEFRASSDGSRGSGR
jgi:hypothetical protein